MLFADRTFSSLDRVASCSFGTAAGLTFRFLTRWSQSSVGDYLSAPCFKIVANDFDDLIVSDMASLKSGISDHCSTQIPGTSDVLCKSIVQALESLYKVIQKNATFLSLNSSRTSEVVDSSLETGKYRLLSRENIHEDELIGNLILRIS
jgi:hypothetical protein